MSRSRAWREEWAFFLNRIGKRQYNPICNSCIHTCKQSFRAILEACPRYIPEVKK